MSIVVATRRLTAPEKASVGHELAPKKRSRMTPFVGTFGLFGIFIVLPELFTRSGLAWYEWLGFLLLFGTICFGEDWYGRWDYNRRTRELPKELEGLYNVLEAEANRAVYFEGLSDIGPYWLGETDDNEVLVLHGEYLFDVITRPMGKPRTRRTGISLRQFKIVFDSQWREILVDNWGEPLVVDKVRGEKEQAEYEAIIAKTPFRPYLRFPGRLETWTTDLISANFETKDERPGR